MSLNDTSVDVAEAIAQSKKMADQEWLSDYVIGFLKSPSWVTPVMEYIDQHCIVFDTDDENKLEYTRKHNEFRALIDGLLAAHLLEVSISSEEFEQFLHAGLANKSLHHILVEQLLAVDDFITFKAMMIKRNNELQMQAFQQLEKDQQRAVQEVANDLVDSVTQSVAIEEHLEAQDETVLEEAEEVLSPTSGRAFDWSMYEEEDKLISEALRISKEAAISNTVDAMSDIRKEQEEAEMKLAMALSLQVLQDGLALESMSSDTKVAHGMTPAQEQAPSQPVLAVQEAEPPAATVQEAEPPAATVQEAEPPAPVPAPAQSSTQATVSAPEEKPFSISEMDALDNSRPKLEKMAPLSMPKMVTLAPVVPPVKARMKNVTTASLYEDGTSGPMPVKANVVDMGEAKPSVPVAPRVETAAMKLSVAAAASVPTPQRPTAEEVRQRQEHLRKQREILVQKKKQEREQKLQMFQKIGGKKAFDKVDSESTKNDSQDLVSQLSAKVELDVPAVPAKDADRAAQMRRALTAKLKESLYQTLGTA